MAIGCPRCGREYDVTLFQFERTVRCACGAEVALAHRRADVPARQAPSFLADAMLGRLARWLRIMGLDTVYEPHADDAELARRAVAEGRVLLTRDRALPGRHRAARCLVVKSEWVQEQLRQVLRAYPEAPRDRLFTRCTRCNGLLQPASKQEVGGQVPQRVLLEQERFARCTDCHRIYWRGSHTRRIETQVSSYT